jgi:hypothetical protein
MRINEFQKKITAHELNESAAKTFGQKINLESFTTEQLEDARNKLRTKIYQFENTSGYNAVHKDESHAKNKMFLDVLNHAIAERAEQDTVIEFTDMERMVLSKVDEGVIDFDSLPEELQAKVNQYNEQQQVTESMVTEGEEEKAEFIMSARDMVDRITGWMEDTANMQAENMLKLVDAIRDELGQDVSMEFESIIKPALATIYTALESSRTQLNQGVTLLTGEGEAAPMMGEEPPIDDMGGDDMDMGIDDAMPGEGDGMEEPDDAFAASSAAAGGEEAAGRMKRESVEYSRRLGQLLAPKKK